MSRLTDAQFGLVYAVMEDIAEERGLTPEQVDSLRSSVFNDDRLWGPEHWLPLREFISDKADYIG